MSTMPVESLASDIRSAEALRAKATSGDPEALRAAARQFEAMFVQIMLKTMRETRFASEDDPFANSSSLKLYQELLDQQWAQRMANGRGLGFAEAMYAALSRNAATPGQTNDATTPNQAGATPATTPAAAAAPAGSLAPTAGATAGTPDIGADRQAFIDALRPYAEQAAEALGLPAEFVLAQAALETGWGKRQIVGADGQESFNVFGIKAGAKWKGSVVETLTTEFRDGLAMKLSQSFRAYDGYEAAFRDYVDMLRRRYPLAAAAGDDAEAFASGLVAGRYATDPAYAEKVRGVIGRLT